MTIQERTIQDALGDRFTLIRELGRGGMAVVYLARDCRHDRNVALKVLRPDLINTATAERFLREIRLEGRLQHPNILPIYDSAHAGPFLYYIMPFVEGETLSARLAREGALPVADAIRIAREVAEALAYAHSQGVIHRDVKPQNILLSGGHAVLADFGVAHAVVLSAAANLTNSGVVLGTPMYMSPEQADASGRVDERSDIYSLGCVLYETLAGEPAFTGRTAASIFAKHFAEPAPSLQVVRPGLPPSVLETVEKMLAKVPADRFRDAQSLIAVLDRAALALTQRNGASSGLLRELARLITGDGLTFREFVRRHPRIAVMAVSLVALLLILTSTPLARLAASGFRPAPPRYVAVLPFSSTDSADAVLAAGLTHSFTQMASDLAAGNQPLWVVPAGDMLEVNVHSPAEIRRVYPVDVVVAGQLRRAGAGERSLVLELFDVRRGTPKLVDSLVILRPSDSLSDETAEVLLGRALRIRTSRLQAGDRLTGPLQATSPAQRFYLLGMGQLQRAYDAGSLEAAVALFRTALAEDSVYAPAYAGLCEAFWESFLLSGDAAKTEDARRMCDRAVALSRSDPLTLVSLGRTQHLTGQVEQAERTLRTAIQRNAGAEAYRWLGHVLAGQGRLNEAEREFKRAIKLRPDIWIYYADLGAMYNRIGRYEEAMRSHREVVRLSPDNFRGYNGLGASLMFLNHMDEAASMFRQSIEAQPNSFAYRNVGYLLLRDQRYDEAVAALRRGIVFNQMDWWTWRWLAHAQHWRGDATNAQASWRRVVQLIEPQLKINHKDHDLLCGLAEALVALGERERGLRQLSYLASLGPSWNNTLYCAGRTYEMLGSRSAALQYIHQALARGFDRKTVATDPWLARLRTDPLYEGPGF